MELICQPASAEDVETLYRLNKELIDRYEDVGNIEYDKVLGWVRRKLEGSIGEYTCLRVDGEKAGYFHFLKNEDGSYELDDLYIFERFQNRGIGTAVIEACCQKADGPVYLFVFIRNGRARALYERLGFKTVETIRNSRLLMKWER